MKLLLTQKKPTVNLDLPPLCLFRSSKGYLWSLIRDRLFSIQESSNSSLHVLDAACHALITREMFPSKSLYYGLDISIARLNKAYSIKKSQDVLFRADLTRPLSLNGAFDVVVSCNTMSHLPKPQQIIALDNLSSSVRKGGDLFVNYSLEPGFMEAAEFLLREYESVQPIYFDSFLSASEESKGLINQGNVGIKIDSNEVSLPNDASLHRQVLYHAHNKLFGDACIGSAPRSNSTKTLNTLPNVSVLTFENDDEVFKKFLLPRPTSSVVLTSLLYDSHYGRTLIDRFGIPFFRFDDSLDINGISNPICILGLEEGWTLDVAADRLLLNHLREVADLDIYLLIVASRNGSYCKPSLVATDY